MKWLNILVVVLSLAMALDAGMRPVWIFISALLIFIVGWAVYFVPSYIAIRKNHPDKLPIFVLNLCGGWLVVGWIAAIVWAVMAASPPKVQPTDITTQLAKLDDLRNKGALSEEEFQAAKSKLFN
ncbi:MAG: superinfection immunity protein [Betaproteobacteria bacterium]|nr:superinfection immunity protein [Betaproteobacteria bacterium]